MKRVYLAIGSLALVALLGIAMVGRSAVDAQTPSPSGTPIAGDNSQGSGQSMKETWLATLASKLGVTTEQLQTAIDETNQELGTGGMMRGGMDGGRHSHRGESGRDHMGNGEHGHGMMAANLAAAATFLGITEDQLRTELRGSTFVKVAIAHGKTLADVRAFMIQQATADIDARLQEAESDESATPGATEVPATPALTPAATTTA